MSTDFSAIILAAGNSGRMGVPKWSLMYDEKLNFAQKIAHEFSEAGANKIALVVNTQSYEQIEKANFKFPVNIQLIKNENPELGRFNSLKIGVEICDPNEHVCFTNIDNPFVSAELVLKLLENIDKADYIAPCNNGKGGHPVVISQEIVVQIASVKQNDFNLKEFLKEFDKYLLETSCNNVLVNINTIDQYYLYFKEKV